ncbi:hypothetical protein TSOC_005828 [Tetrabaena socialis]|uniref:Uncharacterized protein n=1 Tax=Tetrabaena socialis TaxID=47790 RepID=A0A2J8A558_9CHLO|nr:hypothetical protein TSOC_005828 [Tetrabaena socialis]|eukprot:PNH07672.1 hypothetical protein TSOC_005828 [Tetrabaena socialis]
MPQGRYPPVPEFTVHPGQHQHQHQHHNGGDPYAQSSHRGPPPPPPPYPEEPHPAGRVAVGPSPVYVAPPKIEMQPWARNAWRWLANNTSGVARVDLRRPTPPLPEQYDGNLLFVRSRHDPAAAVGGNGARIKITRSFLIRGPSRRGAAPDGSSSSSSSSEDGSAESGVGSAYSAARAAAASAPPPSVGAYPAAPLSYPPPPPLPLAKRSWWSDKPLLDIGVGFNLDMDQQQVQPIARIKIKDLLSIQAAPMGLLKISRCLPLGPVMLKVGGGGLDNAAGSGIHLTPGGIEFDEQVLRFGTAVTMRASAGLAFPRQLPIAEGDPHPLKLEVHRLSLKSIW